MKFKIFTVDAFTDRPFAGNPAAVCLLTEEMPVEWMTDVAAEMNLSETAFLLKKDNEYSLRWFTPKVEVQLCGHATLASAHILWQKNILSKNEDARFHTLSGLLTVKYVDGEYEMNFPAYEVKPSERNEMLIKALGIEPVSVSETEHQYICEFQSEEDILKIAPSFETLMGLEKFGTIITARSSDKRYDFISRFFAPSKGINEDPVTGSAHCALAPYWKEKTGENIFSAYQASERGGVLKLRLEGDRVFLKGSAVTITEGELLV